MKIYAAISALILPLLLANCRSDVIFESEKTIPGGQWTYRDSLDFNFEISDTSAVYDLWLDFSHAQSFASQNIYLKLFTRFPDGKRPGQVLSIDLFDAEGKPLGKRSGEHCRYQALLQERAFFNSPGAYGLTVHQYMRQDSLPGISQLALRVVRAGKK